MRSFSLISGTTEGKMDRIETIKDYILFLITQCGLSVTLHPLESERVIGASELMQFNIHDNPYCAAVKASAEGKGRCLAQQRRVLARCNKEKGSFCGVCHAGVFEFVYPLYDGNGIIGFISVGGYASAQKEKAPPREKELSKAYHALKSAVPEKKQIDTLLYPLCQMLELAYRREAREAPLEDTLIPRICAYVRQHFTADITAQTLCREFSCSRSYLSHAFKRETGKSIPEYLTDVRLAYAKRLLRYSAMNVTQIAFSTGFEDSNYFSTVFKKHEGLSPLSFRKKTEGTS